MEENNSDVNQVIKDGTKNKSSKSKNIFIILTIIFLICFLVTLVLLIYEHNEYITLKEKYDSKVEEIEDYSYNEELYNNEELKNYTESTNLDSSKTEGDLEENIEIEALGITKNGDFAIKVINNNEVPVNIDNVSTIFKDENGTFMKKAETYDSFFCIAANSEVIVYDWGFDENFSQYPNYEFDFSLSNISDDFLYNNFEVSSTDTGDQISIQVKNNNHESIESMKVNVVYYENESIVGIQSGYSYDSTVAEGDSAYINVYYPEDSDYNEVSFDRYEIYIVQANKNY